MPTTVPSRHIEWTLTGLTLPLTLRTAKPMTDDELLVFSSCNDLYRMERNAQGELEIMTPVGGEGSRWESYVTRELDLWTEEHGGICFSSNGGFSLPDGSMLSPDASWVAEPRWNALTSAQQRAFPPLCPDFVIEVLSATDSRPVLKRKMDIWLANGAKLAWMIDPRAETVLIYRPEREPEVLVRPEAVDAGEPVAGFRLRTFRFWK